MPTLNEPNEFDDATESSVAAPYRAKPVTVPPTTPSMAGLPKMASMSRAAATLPSTAARGVAASCNTMGA
jgi:hypothetical protein